MSWEGYTIYQPEERSDYRSWKSGWHLGLPTGGQISSMTCGAMPFRTASDGINAKKCLRGEDWAWIYTWFDTHFGLPAPFMRADKSISQVGYLIASSPKLQQLSCAMEMTSSLWDCFGQVYDLPNQEVQYEDWERVISSGLSNMSTMTQQIPAELNGSWDNAQSVYVPLYLSGVSAIFEDLAQLSCTLGVASYSSSSTPYSYSQRNQFTDPSKTVNNLSGVFHWDGYYYHNSKEISMRIQPYLVVGVRHSDWSGEWKYCTYKCGTPRTVTNTEQQTGRFYFPSTINGELIAQGACNLFDVSPEPAAELYHQTYCEVYIYAAYMAISAWYMQL